MVGGILSNWLVFTEGLWEDWEKRLLGRGGWLYHHTHTYMSGIPIGARADSLLGRRRWPGAACTAPWSAAGRSADGSGRTPRRPSRRPDRRGGSGCAGSVGACSARPFRGCTVWPLGSGTVRVICLVVVFGCRPPVRVVVVVRMWLGVCGCDVCGFLGL